MAPRIEVDDFVDEGRCWALWRPDLPCPNPAEWIIENTTNSGYALMCGPHKDGFVQHSGEYIVIPYTRADSERLAARVDEKKEGV